MHLPTRGTPLRGALLYLVARLSALRWGLALVMPRLLKESRIIELPEEW